MAGGERQSSTSNGAAAELAAGAAEGEGKGDGGNGAPRGAGWRPDWVMPVGAGRPRPRR